MVDFLFLENFYNKSINFEKLLNFLTIKNNVLKTKKKKLLITIFSSVQFLNEVKILKEMLKNENYTIIEDKPERTNYGFQILGCDTYSHSFHLDFSKLDFIIYIGDGMFHPQALLYALNDDFKKKSYNIKDSFRNEIVVFNPINEDIKVLTLKDVEVNLRKRKVNLNKFYMSDNIGVFITSKVGQSYLFYLKDLKSKLREKYSDKNFYFFLGDNFNSNELENFPYIDCWVNTACPRIGYDDVVNFKKCLINIKDILDF